MSHILVVEDTEEYVKIIQRTLADFKLTICSTAEQATDLLRTTKFDLILLDITLPKKDGYSLLTEIQSERETSSIPVLCLTARNGITDKVTAFSLGADDYLTKPFDPIELRARVEARMKKSAKSLKIESVTTIGDIEIDHDRHRVTIHSSDGKSEVLVTQTEFKLLCCLSKRPEQVYSRDQLLVAAWGEDAKVLDRVVDVHICLLRKKLGKRSGCIKAVTGLGYKLIPSKAKAS